MIIEYPNMQLLQMNEFTNSNSVSTSLLLRTPYLLSGSVESHLGKST